MGFQPSNALSAIPDVHTRAELKSLWLAFGAVQKSVSTLIRNNQAVVDYTPSSITLTAGAGLTGGGDLTANRSFAVGAGTGIAVAADSVAVDQSFTPTWTGAHTFSAQDVHNAGVSLGTSGRINSAVTTAAAAIGIYLKPTNTFTPTGTDRWVFRLDDAGGTTHISAYEGGPLELAGNSSGTFDGMVAVGSATTRNAGMFFSPASFGGAGQSFVGLTGVAGAYFRTKPLASATYTAQWGGIFVGDHVASQTANIDDSWGAAFRGVDSIPGASNSGRTWARTGGWRVYAINTIPKNSGVFTNVYGGYIENLVSGTVSSSGAGLTNSYGLYIEEQTKAATINNEIFIAGAGGIWFRDQQLNIESTNDGHLDLTADTSIDMNGDVDIASGKKILYNTSQQLLWGSGSPESVVTAPVASLYLRTDGGASTTLYIKESGSGNTGWIAK